VTNAPFIRVQDLDPGFLYRRTMGEVYEVSEEEASRLVFSGTAALASEQIHAPHKILSELDDRNADLSCIGPVVTTKLWEKVENALLKNGVRQVQKSGRSLNWQSSGKSAIVAFEKELSGGSEVSQNIYKPIEF